MKIFDFSNGKKGEILSHLGLPDGCHGSIVEIDGQQYRVDLKEPKLTGNYDLSFAKSTDYWSNSAGKNFPHVDEEALKQWGAEAVLFCTGEWNAGFNKFWQWHVVGTTEWVKKAHQNGWLTLEIWKDGRATGEFLEA